MAVRFDSFSLSEMTAKPEDAFRLASLAMAEGTRIPGYRGVYSRMRIGDAEVIFRSMGDPATGEEELLGMDTHGATHCVWSCTVVKDLTPAEADPMSRRVLVHTGGEDRAVVDLVCPEVLPDIREGDELHAVAAGIGEMDYTGILRFMKERKPYIQATLENTTNHNAVQAREFLQGLYGGL